jgi:Fe-S oxidoreductase
MTFHPALATYGGLPGYVYAWAILTLATVLFFYVLGRRYRAIRSGQADPRLGSVKDRLLGLLGYGILQRRQPRYLGAGILHILIFWGFVVLGLRSLDLLTQGLNIPVLGWFMESAVGAGYGSLKDVFELFVLGACILAFLRRFILRPARYEGSHTGEAYLVLGLISFLMITDMVFEGTGKLLSEPVRGWLPAAQLGAMAFYGSETTLIRSVHEGSYWLHLLCFFFFLNLLPLSKHFHIITALPNVFLRKLEKGSIKPVRWDVDDLDELDSVGAGRLEEFTWKHILDLYTCTECGRCTDNCPASIIGRPLSPKLISMKLRDHARERFPVIPRGRGEQQTTGGQEGGPHQVVGPIITADEIWSCTTCGACEEECPVLIEYIDKIVDMRRHLVETAQNPTTFNQPLLQMEKTGNPFGKPPSKRSQWVEELEGTVKVLQEGDCVDVLYFVDSYGSFDPRVQAISGAIAAGLGRAHVDFGILGAMEKDSGHQVRRMGEEGLFQLLVEENEEALKSIRFNRIITTDPHAFNTLRKDYPGGYPVCHYSQLVLELIQDGRLNPAKPVEGNRVFTYHDPCYLGRHNGVYEEPREILRAIPGLKLVEMKRSRDRSFCCGGGDVILWHEVEQEEVRMAERRVQMAMDAGAQVIVTACPFCLIHFEDAVKTMGLEEKLEVTDLMELLVSRL